MSSPWHLIFGAFTQLPAASRSFPASNERAMNCHHLAQARFFRRIIRAFAIPFVFFGLSIPATASQQEDKCLPGELPANATPLEFLHPKIPLACWRAQREGDGQGVFVKANFDVTPDGATENILIEYSDPACASEHLASMIAQLRYECSELGRKKMRFRMTITSPGG